MGNNMYDLHEVMVYWNIKHSNGQETNMHTFHLCVGNDVAKDFRELLANLNVDGLQEYAKTCSIPIQENDEVFIVETECHPIGSLGFIRDTDISDIRNRFITNKIK